MWLKSKLSLAAGIVLLAAAGAASWASHHYGGRAFHNLLRRRGSYWEAMALNDPRLSPSMQLALTLPPPHAISGPLVWREIETGFAVAELSVIADGREVDRILLNRIDSLRYRFVVRNEPASDRDLDQWEQALPEAVLIVNGSYFNPKGLPDTPLISEGVFIGPENYDAKAGAFVAGNGFAAVKDLTHQDWQSALAGATNAMVSYPLLVGSAGQIHVSTKSRWLANRTFVAEDTSGRIVIGTTKDAFFSLDRLAEFLKDSPLGLKIALNLDGGPVACQSVRLHRFHRKYYARWEAQVSGDKVRLLSRLFANSTSAMPIVLTAERR